MDNDSRKASPSPVGTKCRLASCPTQVIDGEKHLWCEYHWAMISSQYRTKLIDAYDPKQPLKYQPQTFLQARIEADKHLIKTEADHKMEPKKKTG